MSSSRPAAYDSVSIASFVNAPSHDTTLSLLLFDLEPYIQPAVVDKYKVSAEVANSECPLSFFFMQ